jgi:hypothetical protein
MSLTTYSGLQAVIADRLHRDDLTTQIVDAIALAEAEMETDCRLVDFEATATVTITAGVGTMPTGYNGIRSVYWVSSPNHPMDYIPPDRYDSLRAQDSGDGFYYTVSGSTIRTTPMGDGSVVLTYTAHFSPLSTTNTSNTLLTNYPDAYLYGTLKHMALHTQDDAGLQKFGILFNAAKQRIVLDDEHRTYGGSLQVRAR